MTHFFLQSPEGAVIRFNQTKPHTMVLRCMGTGKVIEALSVAQARERWAVLATQGWQRV